jgi:hypothetical protein
VVAESVVADLANEGALHAEALRSHRHVGRRAAGLGPESRYVCQSSSQLRREHVDQELT